MKQYWKRSIALLCAIAMLAAVTACDPATGKPSESKESGTSTQSEAAGDATTISFITWRSEDAEVLAEMVSAFEVQNSNIKVDLEITSSDMTEYYTILKSRLLSNEGADVFQSHPGAYLDELVQAGYCKDLTDSGLSDLYNSSLLESGIVDDKLYGLLQTYNSFAIFYNKTIFSELGLEKPTNYTELVAAAKASVDAGYMPIAAGFAEAWTTGMVYEQLYANYADGDDYVMRKLETGELKFTDEPFASTFNDMAKMLEDGIFQENAMGTKYDSSLSLFSRGEATMLLTGTWSVGGLSDEDASLEFGLFSLPGVNADAVGIVSPSQLTCINSKGEKQEAAMKFLEFFSSKEGAAMYAEGTKQAATVSGVELDVPELEEVAALMSGKTAILADSYIKDAKVVSITDELSAQIFSGMDVAQAIEKAQNQMDELIAENADE